MKLLSQEHLEKIKKHVIDVARGLAPRRVKDAIGADVTSRQDGWSIAWKVDLQKAPEARAFEYGSGTHAQVGPKKYYIIKPRKKKVLAFHWETADVAALKGSRINWWQSFNKFQNSDTDGPASYWNRPEPSFAGFSDIDERLQFNWVRHPGVSAANSGKGYMRLAFDMTKNTVSTSVLDGAKAGLGKQIRRSGIFGFERDVVGRFVKTTFKDFP